MAKSKTILIVSERITPRNHWRQTATDQGYEAYGFHQLEQLISWLERNVAPLGVLLDAELIDGAIKEIADLFARKSPTTKLMVVSQNPTRNLATKYFNLGVKFTIGPANLNPLSKHFNREKQG